MGGGRSLRLALDPGKMLHVALQGIAVGLVAINELARKLNFFMRNLV